VTEKIRVEVTEEDIAKGIRENCRLCPIARAIKRLGHEEVAVMGDSIEIGTVDFEAPPEVDAFVEAFDAFRPVQPFAFDLEIPRG